jgi:hypothetical protein
MERGVRGMKLTLRFKTRVESRKQRWIFEVAAKGMNERGLEIHSSTLDRVADAHQMNVRVCRFLSTSIDNRLDGTRRCGIEKAKWRLGWFAEWKACGN